MPSMSAWKLLETIDNGHWHSLENLDEKLKVSIENAAQTVMSLSECGVVAYDEVAGKTKLSPWVLSFHNRGDGEEHKVAVCSIILPPKGCVSIQSVLISNFTQDALEIGVRIDKKLKEISISKVKKPKNPFSSEAPPQPRSTF